MTTHETETHDVMASAMLEESLQDGRGSAAQSVKTKLRSGENLTARIIQIGSQSVFVDYGGRSEGILDKQEITAKDGTLTHQVGDEIEVRVLRADQEGVLVTTGKKAKKNNTAWIADALATGAAIEGLVETYNKGGYEVRIAGMHGFCPFSQMENKYYEDKDQFLSQKLTFRVMEYNEKAQRLVLSRRALLDEEQELKFNELFMNFHEGKVHRGKVVKIEDFGAFVDLGGIEGLLHVSEISRSRIAHPSERLKEGDEIDVKVIKIKEEEGKRPKLSLSMKEFERDVWDDGLPFAVGDKRTGKVVKIESFGVFVELLPGVDGLVHISELSDKFTRNASKAYKVGDEVEVKVTSMDQARKRVGLSIKEILLEGMAPEDGVTERKALKVGEMYTCVVDSHKTFGIFVNAPEAGREARGLIPMEELSNGEKAVDLKKDFPIGKSFSAELIQLEKGKAKFSVKALGDREVAKDYAQYLETQGKKGGSVSFGDLLARARQTDKTA